MSDDTLVWSGRKKDTSDTLNLRNTQSPDSQDSFLNFLKGRELGSEYDLKTGKIRITQVISEGKSGEADIYLARNEDNESFIFKKYKQNLAAKPAVLDIIKSINHPHVVSLIDYGTSEGSFYELMEYARGNKVMDRSPVTDPEDLKKIISQSVSALDSFHSENIVHRDIKPDNLFLRSERGIHVLIADFGISSIVDKDVERRETSFALSFNYAAPELLIRGGLDNDNVIIGPPVDYYSLGLTIISLWKGEDWCRGLSTFETAQMIGRGLVEPPEDMPEEIAHAVRGLLVHQESDRWGCQEIQDWLKGKDVPVKAGTLRQEKTAVPFEFVKDNGKLVTAKTPEDLADLIFRYRDQGIKHLYRGNFTEWIKPQSGIMATELEDIVEDYPKEQNLQDAGILAAFYLLSKEKCFIDTDWKRHSLESSATVDDALDEIGNLLEDAGNAEEYLDSDSLKVFLLAHDQKPLYARIQKEITDPCKKGKISREKAGNKLILLLQKGDSLRISGKDFYSFSDLSSASDKIKKQLVRDIRITDSKFLCWMEEMYLKSDSTDISLCEIAELLELIRHMPWLQKYDRKIFERLNREDPSGYTDLMTLARAGDVKGCEDLIANGADIHHKGVKGNTAFTIAALYKQRDVMELLASKGAEINPVDSDGSPLIHRLACNNCAESIEFLAAKGVSPDFRREKDNWTPLMEAVTLGAEDAAAMLLKCRAKPDKEDNKKLRALDMAVSDGNLNMIRLLMSNGADPNRKSDFPAIHRAVKNGKTAVVKQLLECGASPNVLTNKGQTPLMFAVYPKDPDLEIIELLLAHKAKPYVLDRYEGNAPVSPFCHAAQYQGPEVISLFLKYKANPLRAAAEDKNRQGPLFYAIKGAQIDNIRLLSRKGRWVRAKDKNGETPIQAARRYGSESTIKSLLPYVGKEKLTGEQRAARRIKKSMNRKYRRSSLNVRGRILSLLLVRFPAAFLLIYTEFWACYNLPRRILKGMEIQNILLLQFLSGVVVVWLLALLPFSGTDRAVRRPVRTTLKGMMWGAAVLFMPRILAMIQSLPLIPGKIREILQLMNPYQSPHLWITIHLPSIEAVAAVLTRFKMFRPAPGHYGLLLTSAALFALLFIISRVIHKRE